MYVLYVHTSSGLISIWLANKEKSKTWQLYGDVRGLTLSAVKIRLEINGNFSNEEKNVPFLCIADIPWAVI
jgi:hypothetical protein